MIWVTGRRIDEQAAMSRGEGGAREIEKCLISRVVVSEDLLNKGQGGWMDVPTVSCAAANPTTVYYPTAVVSAWLAPT